MTHPPSPAPLLRPRNRGAWQTVATGMGVTLLTISVAWHSPRTLQNIDGRVYDVLLRHAPHSPAGTVPVVVDIDEESLARYGQWPWPRYRVAQLLDRVRELGAAAVGVDLVFAEPDRTSLPLIAREIERDLGVTIGVEGPAGMTIDNDARLAEALGKGPFVLGYAFDFGTGPSPDRCVLHPVGLEGPSRGGGAHPTSAPRVVCNLPLLARAAGASGFINVGPDPDGTVRSLPLIIEHRGEVFPSLALATLARARGEALVVRAPADGAAGLLVVAGREVPVDHRGNMLVRFRGGGGGYSYLSAAAILEGRVPAGALAGRIAFVGTTAAGLKELRATPFDPVFPGPEVHAAALDTLLQGDFLRHPRSARGGELLATLLAGSLVTLVFARARGTAGLPLLVLGSAALWGGAFWLFTGAGLFVSPLLPQAVLLGTFALLSYQRSLRNEREAAAFASKLALTQDMIIQSMAALGEMRDNDTGGHIQRTRHYVKLLAQLLRGHPRFRAYIDDRTIDLFYKLSPMHDIGKVGIRDRILLKPARLTSEEFEVMKQHTIYGGDTLAFAERNLGDETFLEIAREFALTHQEKWDGTGYPQGLAGEQIPISGRLMAVADVYDALVSRRCYKEPFPHDQARAILLEGRGTHFDPDVLDAFLANQDQFKAIAARFPDAARARETAPGEEASAAEAP